MAISAKGGNCFQTARKSFEDKAGYLLRGGDKQIITIRSVACQFFGLHRRPGRVSENLVSLADFGLDQCRERTREIRLEIA
jgi:hypothetical protein